MARCSDLSITSSHPVDRHSYTAASIRQELQQVPEELGDVYEHILRYVINRKLRLQSFQLFQWVCLAERPLSVREMWYALAAKDAVPLSPRVKCCETRDFVKTDGRMRLQVKTLSGGLAEVVSDDIGNQERVQVIHQSINDFFLSRGLALLASLQHEASAVSSVPKVVRQELSANARQAFTGLA